MVEDIRDLFRHQPVVHGRGDEPGRSGAGAGQVVLERVPGVDDRVRPRLEAKIDQRVAQPVPTLDEFGPGPRPLTLDERGSVRVACGMSGEDIHLRTH